MGKIELCLFGLNSDDSKRLCAILQWTAAGGIGASGRRAARTARGIAAGSAPPQSPNTEAGYATEWQWRRTTARAASALRVGILESCFLMSLIHFQSTYMRLWECVLLRMQLQMSLCSSQIGSCFMMQSNRVSSLLLDVFVFTVAFCLELKYNNELNESLMPNRVVFTALFL